MKFRPEDLPTPRPNSRFGSRDKEYLGKIIQIKDEYRNKNPRNAGRRGKGWKAFNLILSKGGSIAYEEYRKLGGRSDHIDWDLGTHPGRNGKPPYVELLDNTKSSTSHKASKEITMMNKPLNQILYGPPGTGKTYTTKELAVKIASGKDMKGNRDEINKEYKRLCKNKQIEFVTFHQSYGYEEFVEGIRPKLTEDDSGAIKYEIKSGIFKQICDRARMVNSEKKDNYIPNDYTNPSINIDSIHDSKVWSSELGVIDKYRATLRKDCLVNNYFCLPMRETSKNIDVSKKKPTSGSVLDIFVNNVSVNDLIVLPWGDNGICGVGLLLGYKHRGERIDCNHTRDVLWLWKTDAQEECINEFHIPKNNRARKDTHFFTTDINPQDLINYLLKNNMIRDGMSNQDLLSIAKPERDDDNSSNNYVLIIDEINRGNISKILGELITLLEDDKRQGNKEEIEVTLPYSGKKFSVPNNLYIIGTMNTADRSIAFLDTALRRRFQFQEMMPKLDPELLSDNVDGVNIIELLGMVNNKISDKLGRDYQIGHSYFMKDKVNTIEGLANTFRNKICPLLDEYFYDRRKLVPEILNNSALINKNDNGWEWSPDNDVFMNADSYKKIYEGNSVE